MALDIIGPANAPNSTTARPSDDRAFGTSDTWFKDCTSAIANDGTKLKAAVMNALLGFGRSIIRANGNTGLGAPIVTEDNADDAMGLKSILHLIQRGQMSVADDTGAVNVYAVALTPALAEYKKGLCIKVRISNPNTTTTPTISVNGLTPQNILRQGGAAVQPGDVSGMVTLLHDGAAFRVVGSQSPIGGVPTQVSFTTPGAFSWICPVGVYFVRALVWGAGGGGAGSVAGGGANAGTYAGEGGAGGGYSEGIYPVVPGVTYTGVVGAGGNAGSGGLNNAGNGGASSFSAFLSATGGQAGRIASPNGGSPSTFGRVGGVGSGGQINRQGGWGNVVIGTSGTVTPGAGGQSPNGGLGAISSSTAPSSPTAPGGGGGGSGGGGVIAGSDGARGEVTLYF